MWPFAGASGSASFLVHLVLLQLVGIVGAVELPSVQVSPRQTYKSLSDNAADWWAQVGGRVYHAPPSLLGLSQNISDYYYTFGSTAALTSKMKEHVVGGQGRWHIMHLPRGPSMLEIQHSGDRRASFSSLQQLRAGTVLSEGFPPYEARSTYQYPLDAAGKAVEEAAVAAVTPDLAMNFLQDLTKFPTRSYTNAAESGKVEKFLEGQLSSMGYTTCMQHVSMDSGRGLENIVAYAPGTTADTVTVGAHYDSRPYDGSAPGAEDNGSGVAALLAMAKAFKASGAKPKKSVYFVLFAGEEPGLIGSKHFATALTATGSDKLPASCRPSGSFLQLGQHRKADTVRHMGLIMDEIGWRSPQYAKPTINLETYDWDSSQEVMDHLRTSAWTHNGDKLDVVHSGHPFGSDHMSFLEKQLPAVLLINADDEAYPNYHKSTDTIQNVDGELMSLVTRMNLGALMRMAL